MCAFFFQDKFSKIIIGNLNICCVTIIARKYFIVIAMLEIWDQNLDTL